MSRSGLKIRARGWEWMRLGGNGLEWMGVGGSE